MCVCRSPKITSYCPGSGKWGKGALQLKPDLAGTHTKREVADEHGARLMPPLPFVI